MSRGVLFFAIVSIVATRYMEVNPFVAILALLALVFVLVARIVDLEEKGHQMANYYRNSILTKVFKKGGK